MYTSEQRCMNMHPQFESPKRKQTLDREDQRANFNAWFVQTTARELPKNVRILRG